MPRSNNNRDRQLRTRVAQEAARILLHSGSRDFLAAKRKAAERLGLKDLRNLPSNLEIEDALGEHQRIFHADSQPRHLRVQREAALRAMELLDGFRPRLVGAVLRGTADQHSPVHLHVFTDSPEEISWFLDARRIPFEQHMRRVRTGNDRHEAPVYRFLAGEIPLELTVFPLAGERQAPFSAVDGRPMERATAARVRALLAENAEGY